MIPGPAVLYVVARSSTQGWRAGIVSVLGVHAASVVHVIAAVAGLSTLIVASATAVTVVKIVGRLYLIVLGVRSLRAARRSIRAHVVSAPRQSRRLLIEGFVVNLLNPKVALFFLAFLPQFVEPSAAPIWSQTLIFGMLYVALGVCSDGSYAVIAGTLGARVARAAPVRYRSLRYAEGVVLTGLGALSLALPHREPRA